MSLGFEMNLVDNYMYQILWEQEHFYVLNVDEIILSTNDIGMLHETKIFMIRNFEMKYFGETFFVLEI